MMVFVPGIHRGLGPIPPSETPVRSRKPDPSRPTEMMRSPEGPLYTAVSVPCGTALKSLDPERLPALPVTLYLPIADTVTTPAPVTDTPGADAVYATGSVRTLSKRSTTPPRMVNVRPTYTAVSAG